jgi:hypothetical protein
LLNNADLFSNLEATWALLRVHLDHFIALALVRHDQDFGRRGWDPITLMMMMMMMMHDGPRVVNLSGLLIIVAVIGFSVKVGTLLLIVSILRLFLHRVIYD